ncbi:cyclic nucleotide-binding domain-containing protein [Nocardioides sp. 1609]|uniref:cyclic nucleotide-binding domain-containing protein n=1 Tax=Nocardioides sp. 1609 TaxID=2508327 RepID=UPI00106F6724|nr:cyclic nucleotide-binding domain-containing protein [Nocardioides sp. 1609]
MATFFDSFSAREIAQISAHGRRVRLPEGWSPIWERTPADKAYIILDGSVSVRRGGTEIARLGAGDIVGEAAIVGRSLRTATVVALTPLSAIHFTDTDINELLEELPGFRDKLVAVVESRVGGPTSGPAQQIG